LYFAAGAGHQPVVALLLAHGADVNASDNRGWTPLHCAEQNGQKDVAEFLRQHGGQE
jgi:ankyrin repeat protein